MVAEAYLALSEETADVWPKPPAGARKPRRGRIAAEMDKRGIFLTSDRHDSCAGARASEGSRLWEANYREWIRK